MEAETSKRKNEIQVRKFAQLKEQKSNNLVGPVFSENRSKSLAAKFPELEKQWKKNPNPTEAEKLQLMKDTGLSRKQISTYFSNRRHRSKLSREYYE